MDGVSGDANEPNHVYRLHDKQSVFALELMRTGAQKIIINNNNNNNNNEKMDDANETEKFAEPNDSDSELLPQPQQPPERDMIECDRHSDESVGRRDNDNQSSASDECSDNNSTDNISFGSDDLVDNIIILPGNFLSEDEQSTNSDDCVYAYRGGGGGGAFEPVANEAANADDETDYLEMDFEPDPVSELEREADFRASVAANFSPPTAASSESSSAVQPEVRHCRNESTKMLENRAAAVSAAESPMVLVQANCSGARSCCDTAECVCMRMQPSTSANGVPVTEATTRYTGTIPKNSNRPHQNRPQRPKPSTSTASCSSEPPHYASNPNGSTKRCADYQPNSCAAFSSDASRNFKREYPMSSSSRSMSFPGESFLNRTESNVADGNSSDADGMATGTHSPKRSFRSNSCLAISDLAERNRLPAKDSPYSVSLYSYECSVESLCTALERLNVTTDVAELGAALQTNENIPDMDIIQYLTYISKQTCNYKRIMAAIKQCCENVNVDFYSGDDDFLEGIQVPLREIFLRLPASGDLKRILTIRNKRFHQMNVFGKIVSAIRRYPDMRADMINDDYIVIPQYYRSGCIVIQKK